MQRILHVGWHVPINKTWNMHLGSADMDVNSHLKCFFSSRGLVKNLIKIGTEGLLLPIVGDKDIICRNLSHYSEHLALNSKSLN